MKIRRQLFNAYFKSYRTFYICLVSAVLILSIFSCIFSGCGTIKETQEPKPECRLICILQEASYEMLESALFDMAIIDPDDSGLNKVEIENLHKQNKKIFSYLSIGEAENYRYYWEEDWETGNPSFVEKENPDWKGNYKIKYWDEKWQKIVIAMVANIIDKGYDGAYLDVLDAYKYFESLGYNDARQQMVDLVILISKYSKNINANFLIIPQNAEELIEFEGYLDAIDGAGRESLWYLYDTVQDEGEFADSLAYLDRIKASGRLVFVISYCSKDENIKDFKKLARKHGFIPFIGSKELDHILNP